MILLNERLRTVDLPYTLRFHGVTEDMFMELVDEDTKAELLDGVMIVHSPASPRHDLVSGFYRTLLWCYAEEDDLGQVFGPDAIVHLATCRKFAPDGFFLNKVDVPDPIPKKEFEVIPSLIAEVLSSSNRDDDLEDKRPAYQKAGVREIWFIDPEEEEVIVDRRRGKGYTTTTIRHGRIISKAVPGFWIDADWLWSQPLPRVQTCLRKILK